MARDEGTKEASAPTQREDSLTELPPELAGAEKPVTVDPATLAS